MKWEDVCQAFPKEWVLIEAVQAYTNEENDRILTSIFSFPYRGLIHNIKTNNQY